MNSRRTMLVIVFGSFFMGAWEPNWLGFYMPRHFSFLSVGRADEFVLKDGRTIHGRVMAEKTIAGTKDKQFVVEIRPEVLILINQREIKQHGHDTKAEKEYAELIKENQDSIEFHLALAGWCQKNKLRNHETAHYERVIDLAPDNAIARAGLNHVKGKDGRWIERDVLMTEGRGKVNVGGKYRFPEVVALEAAREQAHVERIRLLKDLRGWQIDIVTENRRAVDSRAKLEALDGPHATSAISELLLPKTGLGPRSEPPPEPMRMLYVNVLIRLADPTAVQTLMKLCMNDPSQDIRQKCLDALVAIAPRAATFAFIKLLSSDNPEDINKAGRALAALKDPVAILPLIEHVVTTHKRQTSGSNSTDVSFGQGSFTMGTEKPKTTALISHNRDVLGALAEMTSQNFQYDKAAWLAWYSREYFAPAADLRRDP